MCRCNSKINSTCSARVLLKNSVRSDNCQDGQADQARKDSCELSQIMCDMLKMPYSELAMKPLWGL